MLNLDDAYQQNWTVHVPICLPAANFMVTFWGGMALSMGLMGRKHTLSAVNYTSMKHGVNKVDAKVNELLFGKEVWGLP